MGINVAQGKLMAFALAAFIAGVGGALTGYMQGELTVRQLRRLHLHQPAGDRVRGRRRADRRRGRGRHHVLGRRTVRHVPGHPPQRRQVPGDRRRRCARPHRGAEPRRAHEHRHRQGPGRGAGQAPRPRRRPVAGSNAWVRPTSASGQAPAPGLRAGRPRAGPPRADRCQATRRGPRTGTIPPTRSPDARDRHADAACGSSTCATPLGTRRPPAPLLVVAARGRASASSPTGSGPTTAGTRAGWRVSRACSSNTTGRPCVRAARHLAGQGVDRAG